MRYIVFVLLGAGSLFLCGSIFGYITTIAGLVPDLLMLISLCIVLNERTAAGMVFAAVFGLLFDGLFSPVMGGNALAYTVSVAIVYYALRTQQRIRIWTPALVGFFGYLLKECVLAVIAFAMGNEYSFFYMFFRFMLTGALLCAGLMIPAYYLMHKLYSNAWMRPRKSLSDDLDL